MTLGMVGQTTVLQVLRGTKVKVQNHMKSEQGGDKIGCPMSRSSLELILMKLAFQYTWLSGIA